jgi:Tetratricopeptide repeat
LTESLALARERGDIWATALALTNLGVLAGYMDDWTRATALGEEGLALFRTLEDRQQFAWGLSCLGDTLTALGDYARAQELFEEGHAAGPCRQGPHATRRLAYVG